MAWDYQGAVLVEKYCSLMDTCSEDFKSYRIHITTSIAVVVSMSSRETINLFPGYILYFLR